ncbi:MAG: hypothetical protein DRI95_13050 [Bacteroidetes bacterium]|nr:MAG: hypothetical protein DRI95_13050 [Bacteroidota bacterium]
MLTKKYLIIVSALIWYVGSISLFLKTITLLKSAFDIHSNIMIILLSVLLGLVIGFFKGKYLFIKSCRKNVQRINELKKVRFWLFFKPSFMIALAIMIATGAALSRLAEGNYAALLGVAILDLTIGTALLYSSFVYWEKRSVLQKVNLNY